MTLQNLRYVVEVANSRSFSRAARSLFMTQSALSSAIRDVEDELGITIFRRTNRGVQITPDGEDCLKHCKEIIERADYLSIRYQSRNSLRTYFSVSTQHLPFAVRAFDAPSCPLHNGHLMILLRAGKTPGPASLTVSVDGFEPHEVRLTVQ